MKSDSKTKSYFNAVKTVIAPLVTIKETSVKNIQNTPQNIF